jgi:hypothetical protein
VILITFRDGPGCSTKLFVATKVNEHSVGAQKTLHWLESAQMPRFGADPCNQMSLVQEQL